MKKKRKPLARLEPGSYFKDRKLNIRIQIDYCDFGRAYGRMFLVDKDNKGRLLEVRIDRDQKFWLIDMHRWDKFNSAFVPARLRVVECV